MVLVRESVEPLAVDLPDEQRSPALHLANVARRIRVTPRRIGRRRVQIDASDARLVRSRRVIQNLTGKPVNAYRAPSFSITEKALWALDILVEEGFQFDSSIFPIYHDRYGIAGAETGAPKCTATSETPHSTSGCARASGR